MAYTWTDLQDDIKVRGNIPTTTGFTETRQLNLANAILRAKLLPLVMRVREGYYNYDVDFTIDSRTTGYLIPTRAVGGKLENTCFIQGTQRLDAPRYYEEELYDTQTAPGSPGLYIKRGRMFVLPIDGAGFTTLRSSIIMRPNQIIANASAAQITAISTGTKTLTFTSGTIPTAWATTNTFDLIQANPHFDWLAIDQVVTTITTTTMVFSSTLPTDLAVGDWVALAGQSPVIQLPTELHPMLAQEIANCYLKSKGDAEAYKLGIEEVAMMKEGAIATINPRIETEGKKLSNRTGLLRRRR